MSENDGNKRKTLGKGTLSLGTLSSTDKKSPSAGATARPKAGAAVEVRRPRSTAAKAASAGKQLTNEEREARIRALKLAQTTPKKPQAAPSQSVLKIKQTEAEPEAEKVEETAVEPAEDLRSKELAKLKKIQDAEKVDADEAEKKRQEDLARLQKLEQAQDPDGTGKTISTRKAAEKPAFGADANKAKKYKVVTPKRSPNDRRRDGKLTVSQAINNDFDSGRTRSLAAQRRAREKERMQAKGPIETVKQVREVIIPEVITVQELANRMAERVGDVVKKLMDMGVMATSTQNIDTDTAELITEEFGHTVKRVSEADVEDAIVGAEDNEADLQPRPPVVTIMGHVDHGKTSLLDAMRETNVTDKEAGGITQHIGAYQIKSDDGQTITFIDTPGHAAFTEMRARGADVTDIVILVVAADDSVMPQTIEAISHAKAAEKPIIIAINKCDLPAADANKVRTELLQHDIVVESMGGDIQELEVSAKTGLGLKELEEAILLQAEVMELTANPDRTAVGSVVEARLEQGKGSVATVLVQRGTLKIGDIFVTGSEWGKVRALTDDKGKQTKSAVPGQPIEVLGLNGTPNAGDDFTVVKDEAKAREVAEFRERRQRALLSAQANKGSLEQMMQQIQEGEAKDLHVVIKGDVQGSVEAMASSLRQLTQDNKEVNVSLLHTGVGAITESDITLANASGALIVGFNVRANAQARAMAKRDGVEVRYYSIIYNVIDDIKALLSGMLSPEISEEFIGYATIRQVFSVSKVGKIAGCMVTEGLVKRGAKVRLLRDNVVIHEGTLKTLQRFKDEVKDVREGFECGMAFENYDDIKENDVIEAFEMVEKTRSLEDIQKEREKAKKKEKAKKDD